MSSGADRIPCFSSYKPCWSRLASRAITRMGGGLTSGTSTPKSIRLARKTRRKSRVNTSICGPGSNGWCAAPSVFPKRSTCTIWSLGYSSIAMNLDEPYETGSTPLRHLQIVHTIREYLEHEMVNLFPALPQSNQLVWERAYFAESIG